MAIQLDEKPDFYNEILLRSCWAAPIVM
jgi:hypothetical protein